VRSDERATLAVGGFLTNSVSVTRRGEVLVLSYRLAGQDGSDYSFAPDRPRTEPEFAVYQGDKKIASGKFQYG